MKVDPGEALFTFAVISDSHVNEAEGRSLSPYPSNRRANGRLRHVVRELEAFKPAFVIHLGDMGNPLPHLAAYGEAVRAFKAIVQSLRCPLHLVPGNHCVGDKPVGWVPVPRVSRPSLELYEEHYGAHYSAFDHGPCHFALLNSLLINSGLKREREQRRWLERDLDQASRAGRRVWLMMHYPPYVTSPDEPASYDNLDEPGRSWLLELAARHRIEAVYCGHVHNYFTNRYVDTEIYTLPATSFVRHDYSDMFSVEPADDEGGRADDAKLGYCIVRVHESGHVNQIVRTNGRVVDRKDVGGTEVQPNVAAGPTTVGMELRENWLAPMRLRANNSVSPFVRRWARNDWAVLALEEMGVSKVRVALQALDTKDVTDRMAILSDKGWDFVAYSYGIPNGEEYRLVRGLGSLLAGWELILGLDQIKSVARGIARLATGELSREPLPCYLSEVRDAAMGTADDANVKHEANYGFLIEEQRRITRLLGLGPIVETFSGLVFRIRRRGETVWSPWRAIQEVGRMGRKSGMQHQVHVLFSGNLTADRMSDEVSTANRVAEATIAAWVTRNVDVYLDTFEDVDRGYFLRSGLVDRRYNPRLAAKVVRNLGRVLRQYDPASARACSATELPRGRLWTGVLSGRPCSLLLPQPDCRLESINGLEGEISSLSVTELEGGTVSRVAVSAVDGAIRFVEPLRARSPLWMQAD